MRPSSSPSDRRPLHGGPSDGGPSDGGPSDGGLFEEVLARGGARAAVSDEAWLTAMLAVEAALAWASAAAGVIPSTAADDIATACRNLRPDPAAIGRGAAAHGTPVLPLVEAIRAALPEPTREFVHRGATSQDVLDSASMLVAKWALAEIRSDLEGAAAAVARLAAAHRDTPMVGRTLLQQAVPVTFGLTAAGWLAGLDAAATGLRRVRLTAQLGGAAGTLAGLGPAGPAVVTGFAERLGLAAPDLPWHTERSRITEMATALGVSAGAVGKVARDVTLLSQNEVGEVSEGTPGGSTAMAHKRNPIAAVSALAAAAQAPGLVATLLAAAVQEHQRAAGGWHAEWRPQRELLVSVGSAAAWLRTCLSGLVVHTDVLRANLDRAGWHAERGAQDPLGSAGHFVDAALARHQRMDR
jgi:3-carboxy-cis,cis-muconate cycloisomerase